MDFSSLTPVDSWSVPISSYLLSFNRGNPLSWGETSVVNLMFGVYKAIAWLSLMLLNVVASFDWLRLFVDLLQRVSDSVTGMFGSTGVLLMALGVALAAAGVNWMRRNNHRSLYHLGLAVLLMMIATAMVSPARMAGDLLGLSRDAGAQIGTTAAGTPRDSTLSQILADKLVREPTQRWNYSHDLDSLGCGDSWSDYINAAAAHRISADKVKDAANACGNYGPYLHAYAMNPDNAVFDGVFAIMCIIVFAFFSSVMWGRMLRTGFATVLHGSSIKPTMYFVPAGAAAQNLFVRNGLAAGLGAGGICVDVIVYIIGASFTAAMATITGSGLTASILTASAMIGIVLGSRQYLKNLRPKPGQVASNITHSPGPPPMLPAALSSPNLATTLMLATSPAMKALHPALAPLVMAGTTPSRRTPNSLPQHHQSPSPAPADGGGGGPSSERASRAATDAAAPQIHTSSRRPSLPAPLPGPEALPTRQHQPTINGLPAASAGVSDAVINAGHTADSSPSATPRQPTPVAQTGPPTWQLSWPWNSTPAPQQPTPPPAPPIPSYPPLSFEAADDAARAAIDVHRGGPRDDGAP
jgi:hypothetical protein